MKKIISILLSAFLLTSCSDSLSEFVSNIVEGDEVKLTVSMSLPDMNDIQSRAFGDIETDDADATYRNSFNLWLYVFDNSGNFVQMVKAEPKTKNPAKEDETLFDVTLYKSTQPRIIHFVAQHPDASGTPTNPGAGHEMTLMSRLSVTNATHDQDAFWARVTKTHIDEDTKFLHVPMVRNYAMITLDASKVARDDDHQDRAFVYQGFLIVNKPTMGSVAPYNQNSRGYAVYSDYTDNAPENPGPKTYDQMKDDQQFYGYMPLGTTFYDTPEELQALTQNALNARFTTNDKYMYEVPNATDAYRGTTYLVMKGTYNGTTKYYKLDLVRQLEGSGINEYYNLLRNFHFTVKINSLKADAGYRTFEAACEGAANNNVSVSVITQNVTNISDGTDQRLYVTDTYFCFTEGGASQDLKFKYIPITGGTTYDNSVISVSWEGDNIFASDGEPTIAGSDDSGSDWRTVNMTLADPGAQPKVATVKVYVDKAKIDLNTTYANSFAQEDAEYLVREITVVLRPKYQMYLKCPPSVTGGNEALTINLLIPTDVNERMFPLTFYLEPELKSIYPDTDTGRPTMPVHLGESIANEGELGFQYERTISWADYQNFSTMNYNGGTYKVVPCYFKTNTATSSTWVYAQNKYFTDAKDRFSNQPAIFEDYQNGYPAMIEGTDYLGKGYPVLIYFKTTQAANGKTLVINVNEGGSSSTLNYVPTTAGNQIVTYYTNTFGSDNITATVSWSNNGQVDQQVAAAIPSNRRHLFSMPNFLFKPMRADKNNAGTGYNEPYLLTNDPEPSIFFKDEHGNHKAGWVYLNPYHSVDGNYIWGIQMSNQYEIPVRSTPGSFQNGNTKTTTTETGHLVDAYRVNWVDENFNTVNGMTGMTIAAETEVWLQAYRLSSNGVYLDTRTQTKSGSTVTYGYDLTAGQIDDEVRSGNYKVFNTAMPIVFYEPL